jgi:hypothetical protein
MYKRKKNITLACGITCCTADQIAISKSQETYSGSAEYLKNFLVLMFFLKKNTEFLLLKMSSDRLPMVLRNCEYVEAVLFGSNPNATGTAELPGRLAMRMKS